VRLEVMRKPRGFNVGECEIEQSQGVKGTHHGRVFELRQVEEVGEVHRCVKFGYGVNVNVSRRRRRGGESGREHDGHVGDGDWMV
jgi:hypothetical protein